MNHTDDDGARGDAAGLDPATGHLTFSSPAIEISPGGTRERFESSDWFARFESLTQNPPWALYGFRDFRSQGERLAGSLCFRESALQWITLAIQRAEFGSSWSDFSKEKELARQAAHDAWLAPRLAGATPTRTLTLGYPSSEWTFAWGAVHSGWDVKNGLAEIVVRYRRSA